MITMTHLQLACTALLSPLGGALVSGLFRRHLGDVGAHRTTIFGVLIAFACALWLGHDFLMMNAPTLNTNLYTWAASGRSIFHVGVLLDTLSVAMMLCVTFVSLFVHIYSIGYMQGDSGYGRFFAYVSLFTFAMLALVLSNNGMQLFFGWEGVGAVSYLLIGFWFHKPSASLGALKAFVVNRFGDFGFLLGLALCLWVAGSLQYDVIFASASKMLVPFWGQLRIIDCICLGLFIGAMGKSAQIPLHVWLPESMEGPTPISALIHAATMVTAGIYMIIRMSPLFQMSPMILDAIMIIGALGAFFLGCVGLVQFDIKKVVAYSTLSQLGYMMAGVGASAYAPALFHLLTHACFKALLFLGAGSVIIGMHHEQDMREMGGLKTKMPITYWTCLIGSLSLIALPPFAGFYSKDAIITAVGMSTLPWHSVAWVLLVLGTFVTALYTFRAFFMTFHGTYRGTKQAFDAVHESPWTVCLPLVVLAVPSIFLGMWIAGPMFDLNGALYQGIISTMPPVQHIITALAHEYRHTLALYQAALHHGPFWLTSLGVLTAYVCYMRQPQWPGMLAQRMCWIYQVLVHKFGFDAFNDAYIVRYYRCLSQLFFKFFDQGLIDRGMVMGTARWIQFLGRSSGRTQTGFLYDYAFAMILGVVILLTLITIV